MNKVQNQKTYKECKLMTAALTVFIAIAVLTVSIAAPLLCRPFYYAHIQPMRLTEISGLTEGQIRQTYDQVMNYCLGLSDDFELTYLSWSAEGAAHFADVRVLFILDLCLAAISIFVLAGLLIYCKRFGVRPYLCKGHGPGFLASVGMGITFVTVGIFASLDFERAFEIFHKIFFPGKDNWIFDETIDPVIYLLPQEFFRNCGILIVGFIILCCIVLIIVDKKKHV